MHYLGREALEDGHVRGSRRRVGLVTRHTVKAFEQVPARRQRGIDVDRTQECIDRLRRIAADDVAMAAFFMKPAECRVPAFELSQRLQCVVDQSKIALAFGDAIQHIAIFWYLGQQRLGLCQCLRVFSRALQLAYIADLLFDGHRGRLGCCCVHI